MKGQSLGKLAVPVNTIVPVTMTSLPVSQSLPAHAVRKA